MAEQIHPDEAARALAQIRDRQEQVIDTNTIPVWYWWLLGALIVLLAAAVESQNPATIGIGVAVFVLGLLAGTGWIVRHALRVQVRNELLGARGIALILGFVAVTVLVSLAVAWRLQVAGVSHPATWGNAAGAVLLVAGGPLLTRVLRRIMLGRRAGGAR
jgi:hypothetical protein